MNTLGDDESDEENMPGEEGDAKVNPDNNNGSDYDNSE